MRSIAIHRASLPTARLFVLTALLAAVVVDHADARPSQQEPGSVLVFPWFDSIGSNDTIVSVTNTSLDRAPCPASDRRGGEVVVRFLYFDGTGSEVPEFARYELLTPGATLSVRASLHNPVHEQGFLIASAADPDDWFRAIDHDALLGSARLVEPADGRLWSYTAYSFAAIADTLDPCMPTATDIDADGSIDFDGIEVETFPRRLILDTFLEEGPRATDRLLLMSTAGTSYRNRVDFTFWNNRSQAFQRGFGFTHSWSGTLGDVSPIAGNLGGDPQEFLLSETGWFELRGDRIEDRSGNPVFDRDGNPAIPPMLGVFAQLVNDSGTSYAGTLQFEGNLDGLEVPRGNDDPQDNS